MKEAKPYKEIQGELLTSQICEYNSTFDAILGYKRIRMSINRLNQQNYLEGYNHSLLSIQGIIARIRYKKSNRKRVKVDYPKVNIFTRDFNAHKPSEKKIADITV